MPFLGGNFQIPDIKTGNKRVDAVVVDEESVGSIEAHGCGAKILRGDGAFKHYLADSKAENSMVLHSPSVKRIFFFLAVFSFSAIKALSSAPNGSFY